MKGRIALVTVLADDVPALRDFYRDVLGFEVQQDLGSYVEFHSRGAAPVKGPADMPWGQRAAFFADPEGNVHELFAELQQS